MERDLSHGALYAKAKQEQAEAQADDKQQLRLDNNEDWNDGKEIKQKGKMA